VAPNAKRKRKQASNPYYRLLRGGGGRTSGGELGSTERIPHSVPLKSDQPKMTPPKFDLRGKEREALSFKSRKGIKEKTSGRVECLTFCPSSIS